MLVLGIESTCDETAASIVEDGQKILSSIIFSQANLHAAYGGVYPELASRAHIESIITVIDEAISKAQISKDQIDLVAVANAPGLVGGLLIGVETAKALSLALSIPFIGINHVEAHLYAAMMTTPKSSFPALGIVLSGGHTLIVKIEAIGSYTILGTTIDDALGEAFDKLSVMLGYSYPGGPMIETLAKHGNPKAFQLTSGKVQDKPFAFSYSGLKTACRTLIEKQHQPLSENFKQDLAASFQYTVFTDLAKKIDKAAKQEGLYHVFLGGGVMCNKKLCEHLESYLKDLKLHIAPKELCVDNAVMIAGLGYHRYLLQGHSDPLDLTPKTRIPQW